MIKVKLIDNLVEGNNKEIAKCKRIIGALEEANKILNAGRGGK